MRLCLFYRFNPSRFNLVFSSYVYDISISLLFHPYSKQEILCHFIFYCPEFSFHLTICLYTAGFPHQNQVNRLFKKKNLLERHQIKSIWITAIFARTSWHLIDRRYCFLLHITHTQANWDNDVDDNKMTLSQFRLPGIICDEWSGTRKQTKKKKQAASDNNNKSFTTYLFCTIKRFHGLMHCQEMNMRVLCPVSESCSL